MCCFLAALLGGGFLVKGWRSWRGRLPRRGLALLALGLIVIGVFAAWHLPHYAARAATNERGLLAEIVAAPICRAGPSGR